MRRGERKGKVDMQADDECTESLGLQHIAEILPDVLAAIFQHAAAPLDDLVSSGERGYRWAA